MFAEIKRWGNSLAIRLTRRDLEVLGLREGDRVRVRLDPAPMDHTVDLGELPTFEDPDPRASERHDALLYGRD